MLVDDTKRKELLDTLAALMKEAKLTSEERRVVSRKAIIRVGPEKRNPRTGPWIHCKAGDRVTARFADGSEITMDVLKVGPQTLKLTRMAPALIEARRAHGKKIRNAYRELCNEAIRKSGKIFQSDNGAGADACATNLLQNLEGTRVGLFGKDQAKERR
jgi:hypothetical protein